MAKKTKTEEIQYLGQMLTATEAGDKKRLKTIARDLIDRANFTHEELLIILIEKTYLQEGPHKIGYAKTPVIATIGIGPDHTADIIMSQEDYKYLKEHYLDAD